MIAFDSEVPFDSVADFDGSNHIFMVNSQEPASSASFLCCSPGVAAFIMASINAFSSGGFSFLSSASDTLPMRTIPRLNIATHSTFVFTVVSFRRRRGKKQLRDGVRLEQSRATVKSSVAVRLSIIHENDI